MITKSPLFEFPSPISSTFKKSPCKNNVNINTNNSNSNHPILLHIPAKTATLLLEAALKIQKHSSNNKPSKLKPQRFGLFGSLLKRLTSHRTNKGIVSSSSNQNEVINNHNIEKLTTFDCNKDCSWRHSTSCEDKSLDSETSCSTSVDFVTKLMLNNSNNNDKHECNNNNINIDDDHEDYCGGFCGDDESESCHQSPFRFVLQRSLSSSSLSSGRRTPEFSSPASSPIRHRVKLEGKENYVGDNTNDFQEEEEKEQFSPVSVLDPPFEDDYDIGPEDDDHDHDLDDHDEENEDSFDLETSYAIVQRTKQQLLQKLRRFERLAELDPIELEKRMLEDDDDELEEDYQSDENESNASDRDASDLDGLIREVLSEPSYDCDLAPLGHMKRLVSDLMVEERKEQSEVDSREEVIVKCVAKRFESWKEVKSNTIDMMVEQDFKRDYWNRNNKEQIGEIEIEIELAIFGILVEELAQELACLSGN